ncbi:hypothetical protein IWX46DRAFT_580404 [Phyllosticta citricarpa]|uniref:Uncharacterized protein n=1 Tax=Phyllosticta citricarpa TaxID=55181 RepID=A0ABR1MI87_9PEZI
MPAGLHSTRSSQRQRQRQRQKSNVGSLIIARQASGVPVGIGIGAWVWVWVWMPWDAVGCHGMRRDGCHSAATEPAKLRDCYLARTALPLEIVCKPKLAMPWWAHIKLLSLNNVRIPPVTLSSSSAASIPPALWKTLGEVRCCGCRRFPMRRDLPFPASVPGRNTTVAPSSSHD